MPPRQPYAALGTIALPHGQIIVRKAWAAKQGTFIAILAGPQPALRLALPEWRPRSVTSDRVQVTPPEPAKRMAEIVAFIAEQMPVWKARCAATASAVAAARLVTVADCLILSEVRMAATVRASSLAAYRKRWRRAERYLPRGTLLAALDRDRLQAVVTAMSADGATPAGIRNTLTALHRGLAPALEAGVLPALLFRQIVLPRAVASFRSRLTREQRDALLAEAAKRGQDVHLLFALGLYAGLRRSELLALRWSDVDLTAQVIHIRSAADGSFVTKSGRNRVVPLCAPLTNLLRAAQMDGQSTVLRPDLPARPVGMRWAFRKTFDRVAAAAGVPWFATHDMRRSFATLAVQGGVSIWKVKAWLGHASVQVTERYTADLVAFDADVDRIA